MAKPTRDQVQAGLNGWDTTVNNNFIKTFDRPWPVFLHTGDETNLEASFPAASHDECIVIVDHTVLGLQPYVVDQNHPSASARWVILGSQVSLVPIVLNTASTLDWDDRIVLSNPAGAIALTLRPAGEVAGKIIQIKNLSAFTITVTAASNIDGSGTFDLDTQFSSLSVYSDGATYHILPLSGGGGGASAFTGLTDTPANYSGAGSQTVRVNSGATALEFVDPAFTDLSDTPANYSGAGDRNVKVNAGATALEFVDKDEVAFLVAVSDELSVITTGTAKLTFRMPYGLTLTEVRASLTTASATGTVTVDVNEGGVSVFSTLLTIDATESTSTTAAAAAVISDSALADDAEMTIDIDDAGSSADAVGLKVTLIGRKI